MPGQIRPDKKAMKIFYDIMKTDKDQQQANKKPTEKQRRAWRTDSVKSQLPG
jgi:hypothetical protein